MIDNEPLIETLLKSFATETGKTMFASIRDWLRRKFGQDLTKAAESFVENRNDDAAKKTLEDRLRNKLGASPSLAEELRKLLDSNGAKPQIGIAEGDGSVLIQIQGNNNVVR